MRATAAGQIGREEAQAKHAKAEAQQKQCWKRLRKTKRRNETRNQEKTLLKYLARQTG